jgi:ABC-2 type transport system permease protein
MRWRIIRAIAWKDLQEVRRNRMAWSPMLILPILFCIVIPVGVLVGAPGLIATDPNAETDMLDDMQLLLGILPAELASQIQGMNATQVTAFLVLALMFAPMFLVMPLMTASTIGAESFVGEKERKTIEALLYTPASDRELLIGKLLAAVVPALLVAWGSFLLYTLVLNTLGWPIMGRIWFPTPAWIPMMLWLAPAFAVLGLLASILISARVNSFMEAYQLTSVLVIPVVLLMIGQVSGLLYVGPTLIAGLGVVIWLVNAALLVLALRIFSRRALFGGSM